MTELKPCPFCGSEAHIEKGKVRVKNNKARGTKTTKTYYIGCSDSMCILYGNKKSGRLFFTASKDGIEHMVRRWNRRDGKQDE